MRRRPWPGPEKAYAALLERLDNGRVGGQLTLRLARLTRSLSAPTAGCQLASGNGSALRPSARRSASARSFLRATHSRLSWRLPRVPRAQIASHTDRAGYLP